VTTELALLMGSLVVYGFYLGAQALIFRWRFGMEFAASGRDTEPKPEGALLGRADRALRNFNETYVPLVILLLVAHLIDRNDPVVLWGAGLWYVARIAYLPLYLFGVYMIRSLVWCVGAIGLGLMFFGILF
jgi:uncharacterized MAPEG superfamily protein